MECQLLALTMVMGLLESYEQLLTLFLPQVSEEKWQLTAANGPEYNLCSTYPQLLYVPKKTEVSYIQKCLHVQLPDIATALLFIGLAV